MSKQWAPLCHRGELDFALLTPRRAVVDGWLLRDGVVFIGIIRPDGGDEVSMGFLGFDRLAGFLHEMRPRELHVLGVQGEDVEELRRALADFGRSGACLN